MKTNVALFALAVACLVPGPLMAQTATAPAAPAATAPATPAAKAPAKAAKAPAKAAKAAKPAAVSLKVTVTNGREAAVNTLAFTGAGASQSANLLKTPLQPGKSIVLTVKTTKGACMFDIAGAFADEQEIAGQGIDLCRDKKLTLVE
jgi:hypothetical protein